MGGAVGRRAAWVAALVMLGACAGDEEPDAAREVGYSCSEGVAMTVVFNPVTRIATVLGVGPKAILLPRRPSGSGFRYATERVELRGKGEDATLTVDGASIACRARAPSGS